MLKRFVTSQDGATAVDYALVAGGIALAVAVMVFAVGADVGNLFADLPALVIR